MENQFINNLQREKAELETKLAYLNELIAKHSNGNLLHGMENRVKSLSGTNLNTLVANLFKKENRFLHVREIADLLSLEYAIGDLKEFCNKRLSPVLSKFKKDGTLTNFAVEGKNTNTFWGSPKWLEEKDKPKAEYNYNSKYIASKKVIEI